MGVAAQLANTGWLGYLRGDYRRGDNIEGWTANAGLRYQFASDPAPSVALKGRGAIITKTLKYKAPAAQAMYNWTGFYIGGFFGADWGFTSWTFVDNGATTNPRFAGVFGGAEIGYNYQSGKWVFGVEGDIGGTDARGARPCPNGFFLNCEIEVNWLSAATARIGYLYWDRLLLYVKGGPAIAHDQGNLVCNTSSLPTVVPLAACLSGSDSKTKIGWTVGAGSEFGLAPNISIKAEVLYVDLGADRYNMTGTAADIQRSGFVSIMGLQFHFHGGESLPAARATKY
jgi:opacity protein-like surface antigen